MDCKYIAEQRYQSPKMSITLVTELCIQLSLDSSGNSHQPQSQQVETGVPVTEETEAAHDGDDEEDDDEVHEDPDTTNNPATFLKRRTT